jgi:hypothetical protein
VTNVIKIKDTDCYWLYVFLYSSKLNTCPFECNNTMNRFTTISEIYPEINVVCHLQVFVIEICHVFVQCIAMFSFRIRKHSKNNVVWKVCLMYEKVTYRWHWIITKTLQKLKLVKPGNWHFEKKRRKNSNSFPSWHRGITISTT